MKDKSFSDGYFLLVIGFTLMFLFTCCLTCSAQYYTFNTRDNNSGRYNVKVEGDSISIFESTQYQDRQFTSTLFESRVEYITHTYCGQMCIDIFTTQGQWVLFYCEEDNNLTTQVCEMYYRPYNGEVVHYQKLLK
jgi:hypothetical protein